MNRSMLLAAFLFTILRAYPQDFSATTWLHIDTSITKKKDLSAVYDFVIQLKQKALAEKKYFDAARCYYYQVVIADQRTEDSFYFRNSALIDSILSSSTGNSELQLAMHWLQAKRLSVFTTRNNRFNRQRYERKDIPVNYAAYDNAQLDSLSRLHFEEAKKIAGNIPVTNTHDLLWLSVDPLVFLFKPGVFDLLIADQVYYTKRKYYYSFPPASRQIKIMRLSQDDFITAIDSLYFSGPPYFPQLKYYKEWLDHQKENPVAYYFIETLARKFVHEVLNGRNDMGMGRDDYEAYLLRILASPYNTVKAHAVYQLCLLWYQQSKKYFPSNDNLYNYSASQNHDHTKFDTAYRYHAVKALRLFEQHKAMLDSFAYLKNNLLLLEQAIRNKEVSITMESDNLPGEPILAELAFKNAERIYYSIVRLNNDFKYPPRASQDQLISLLRQFPEAAKGEMDLPATNDFNKHAAYLRFDVLPAGSYSLLFSHSPLNSDSRGIEYLSFDVSSIVVLEKHTRIFVLDRKTGFPLAGAKVKASYSRDPKDTLHLSQPLSKNYTVNQQGFVEINDSKMKDLEVYYNNDTTWSGFRYDDDDDDEPEDVFDKDVYDDLVEYYEDNAIVEVFTDRSIYRPGQTVYFKAIFMTKNPKTGEKIVMNKQNMKGSLFKNVYKKWLKESEPLMLLTDPFNRDVDSIKIKLNDYGSISGSFKLPKTAATGSWSIDPDYLDTDRNDGSFSVEEYKRPSYEISIENPKKELLPGDSFNIKVKVRSFAGATLNNVRINYAIDRRGKMPVNDSLQEEAMNDYHKEEIADSFGYTNAEGELAITVNDSVLKRSLPGNDKEWNFTYGIEAEAIDMTGESYTANTSVSVSSQPVRIRFQMTDKYERNVKNSAGISTSDQNAGKTARDITIKVYRLDKEDKLYNDRKLLPADQWLYSKDQLQQWFPLVDFDRDEDTGARKLVLEKSINTGSDGKLDLDPAVFIAGRYSIEATCDENGKRKGFSKRDFSVYDEKENKLPARTWSMYHLPFNSYLPGDTVKYKTGNSEAPVYSIYYLKYFSGKKKTSVIHHFDLVTQEKGITRWTWKIPGDATQEILLLQTYVLNNQLFTHSEKIYINDNMMAEPEIIIEQYRHKLSPGGNQTFSVSVKTRNENTAAELMTTLYDASLDKLEEHKWELPYADTRRRSLNNYSNDYINSKVNSISYRYGQDYYRETSLIAPGHSTALWWLNPLDYEADVMGDWNFMPGTQNLFGISGSGYYDTNDGSQILMGRAAGLSITSAKALDEVVVMGYASKKNLTGSVVTIRGYSSLSSSTQPLIILDGVPYEGDPGKLDPNSITQGLMLKGADAAALYGSRASNGVLVLSTKGPIVFPELPPEPPIPPRKNFKETAFFFPAIYADKDGYYRFTFTMPESVTEWNWKLLAHTKQLKFAYAERKLNTQLPLMVQPNMPRLLYQGDRIVLQSRISNLDSINVDGRAICKIEDAVTGEDLSLLFTAKTQNDFSVKGKSNVSAAFEIKVPVTQVNPIRVTVSVRSQNFADGEEHIIPILNPKVWIKESMAFRFSENKDTILQPVHLPPGAELYGVALSISAKPQAALINALPYLANYSFDCAEQTFNKLRAYVTAFKLMRTDKAAQQSFDKAKQATDKLPEQNQPLPGELSEQAMPWLRIANKTIEQQKQLFELLDTNRSVTQIRKHLDKLYKLQNSDGGLTWFDGGESDPYISNYVLAGFGKLTRDKLLPEKEFGKKYSDFIERLLRYSDNQFISAGKLIYRFADPLFFAYARRYWKDLYAEPDSLEKKIRNVLDEQWKKADDKSLYGQALLIVTSLRYADRNDERQKAMKQLASIEQRAIKDDVNGIRWKEIADNDDMSYSSEETLALLAEAFAESGANADIFPGIIKWLLTAKSDDYWSSTKATSAVIDLLSAHNQTATGAAQTVSSTIGNKNFSVTDDLLSGSSYLFARTNKPVPVELKKETTGAANGNIIWYYFSPAEGLDKANREVDLKKQLFLYNETGNTWEPVTDKTSLKIADKIKVILTIETPKALRYVYIDDKRAAAFEPKENSSGYRYGQGLGYYLSVWDAGMQFFTSFIPAGRSTISYEMIIAQEGEFRSGPASLQCMYKPEINAYTDGNILRIAR